MEEVVITPTITINPAELTERFSRSSGPGGQGVNTTDSRVELVWQAQNTTSIPAHLKPRLLKALRGRLITGTIVIVASEHRSQLANRQAARERLTQLVRAALAPPPPRRRPTKPSRGSTERRIAAKKRRGDLKRGRGGRYDD